MRTVPIAGFAQTPTSYDTACFAVVVLTRPEHLEASGLSNQDVQAVLDAIAMVMEPVCLAYLWRPMLSDVADDLVLETAVNGRADVLVTMNRRHFEPAVEMFAVGIVSPAEALTRLTKPS